MKQKQAGFGKFKKSNKGTRLEHIFDLSLGCR